MSSNFVVEIKNIPVPASVNDLYMFRRTDDNNNVRLIVYADGSIDCQNYLAGSGTGIVSGAAGTISDGDDVVLVADGGFFEIFVNGASAGSSAAGATAPSATGGLLFRLVGRAPDHIACFPRDVSGLLPKGSY